MRQVCFLLGKRRHCLGSHGSLVTLKQGDFPTKCLTAASRCGPSAAIALSGGLSWSPDRHAKSVFRPSVYQRWERALQEHILHHHELPHGVRLQRPAGGYQERPSPDRSHARRSPMSAFPALPRPPQPVHQLKTPSGSRNVRERTTTILQLAGVLDDVLNQSKEGQAWIFLLDMASIHAGEPTLAVMKAALPHVVLCFIPPPSTSYLQPCDVAIFRSFKSCASRRRQPRRWRALQRCPLQRSRRRGRGTMPTMSSSPSTSSWSSLTKTSRKWAMAEASDDEDDAPMPDAPPEPELIDMPPAPASAPRMSNLERCIALRLV